MARLIVDNAKACREVLNLLADDAQTRSLDTAHQTWLRDQGALFSIWVAKLGVFASGDLSVEHRLRKNKLVAEGLTQILEALLFNFRQVANHYCTEEASRLDCELQQLVSVRTTSMVRSMPTEIEDPWSDHNLEGDQMDTSVMSLEFEDSDCIVFDMLESPSESSGSSTEVHLTGSINDETPAQRDNRIAIVKERIAESIDDLLQSASLIREYNLGTNPRSRRRYAVIAEDSAQDEPLYPTDALGPGGESTGRTLSEAMDVLATSMLRREFRSEDRFKDPSLAFLRQRLHAAMLWRWRRACYCHAHALDLSENSEKTATSTVRPAAHLSEAPRPSDAPQKVPFEPTMGPEAQAPSTSYKGSTLPSEAQIFRRPPAAESATTRSASRVANDKLGLPPLPVTHAVSSGHMYMCPYCGHPPILSKVSQKSWKRHLWEDLAPFICLYDDCTTAETTYTSQHSWLQHIRTAHLPLVWLCALCYQKPRHFYSQSSFQQHMIGNHDSSLSNTELELLSRSCRQSLSFDACLICGLEDGMVSIEASSGQPTIDKQPNLIACMINHLEVLALGSLPWHFGCGEDANSDQAEVTKGDTGDLEGRSLDPSPPTEPGEALGPHQFTFDTIKSLSRGHSPTKHRNAIEAWQTDDDTSTVRSAQDLETEVKYGEHNDQEQTHNMDPSPSPSSGVVIGPPAKLTFEDAVTWKRQMKAGKVLSKLPNQDLLYHLHGRDHVFVVDDGRSMGIMRRANRENDESEVADYIDLLGYMVKRHDPDGIDLHYFNSKEVIKRCTAVKRLVSSVNGTKFEGLSNPQGTLKGILESYISKLKAYTTEVVDKENRSRRISKLFSVAPKLPTPLSIYVLTDGVWESPDIAGGEYLEETLKELIEALRSAGCRRSQVGIQFIRFGSHTYGVQRLEALDQLGRTHGMDLDIVDTEPIQGGNIWKMLLGAIHD